MPAVFILLPQTRYCQRWTKIQFLLPQNLRDVKRGDGAEEAEMNLQIIFRGFAKTCESFDIHASPFAKKLNMAVYAHGWFLKIGPVDRDWFVEHGW